MGTPGRTRGGGGTRHPLNDPTPAGATDARVGAPIGSGSVPLHTRSLISRDGRYARPVEVGPPAGATDASSTSSKLLLAAAKRQGDEARIVTLLHPHQHAPLAFRPRAGHDIAHIGRS
jgi:hypothetical protein